MGKSEKDKSIDLMNEYIENKMKEAAPIVALDNYLKELSIQMGHSPFVQVSVSEVVDKLLDIRNLMPDVVIDGDEMRKLSKGLKG